MQYQRGSIRRISYLDGKIKIQNPIHMTQMQEKLYKAGVIDEYGNYIQGSGDTNELTGPKSKDDTIIDDWDDDQLIYTEDGDLSFDVPGKAGVIDVERLVQEQGADQAIYTLYNVTVRTAEKAIKGYRGVRMDDKSCASIAKKVMRRFDISEKHAPGMETVLADRIKAYTEAVTQRALRLSVPCAAECRTAGKLKAAVRRCVCSVCFVYVAKRKHAP